MKQKEIELYRRDDGFYAGRELKGGGLSADAHKVSGEEIMTMFTEFFTDYCRETGESKLLMQDGEGKIFVTMQAGQPKQPERPQVKAASKREQGDAGISHAEREQARRDNGKKSAKPVQKTPKKPRKARK